MIIGVAGEKKHGKDTVAQFLVKEYGYKQRAFADRLKELCSRLFSIDIALMYDENFKEKEFFPHYNIQFKHIGNLLGEIREDGYYDADVNMIVAIMIKKNHFTSIRDMLQFIGTDILRDLVDSDYHYDTVVRWIAQNNIDNAVISDVRFPNERDNLERDFGNNSATFLVKRPHLQRNESSSHASENSLGDDKDYDFTIINDGTLEDLYQKIEIIMEGK